MKALPTWLFSECFIAWVEALRTGDLEIVAIDGKTSRRAHARGERPLHLVSAWASRQRLVLGQEAVAGKGNEITAIPLLPAYLPVSLAVLRQFLQRFRQLRILQFISVLRSEA